VDHLVSAAGVYTIQPVNSGSPGSVILPTTTNLNFRDSAIGIYSQADTYLDLYADGAVRIGDSSAGAPTNYTNISSAGQVTFAGNARHVNDAWIAAGGLKAPGAKPATAVAHGVLETPAWEFANQAVEGNQETVSWTMRVPNRMDRTVTPYILLGWSADGASPGDCEWQLEYLWTEEGQDTGAAAQDTITGIATAPATADGLDIVNLGAMDLPSSKDVCVHCRLTRLSAGGNDTIAIAVHLHGVCLSWTSDKLGTAI